MSRKSNDFLLIVTLLTGVEPAAFRLGGGRSILLSYSNTINVFIIPYTIQHMEL